MYKPAPRRVKKTNIVRTRTGCITCRERRKKVCHHHKRCEAAELTRGSVMRRSQLAVHARDWESDVKSTRLASISRMSLSIHRQVPRGRLTRLKPGLLRRRITRLKKSLRKSRCLMNHPLSTQWPFRKEAHGCPGRRLTRPRFPSR